VVDFLYKATTWRTFEKLVAPITVREHSLSIECVLLIEVVDLEIGSPYHCTRTLSQMCDWVWSRRAAVLLVFEDAGLVHVLKYRCASLKKLSLVKTRICIWGHELNPRPQIPTKQLRVLTRLQTQFHNFSKVSVCSSERTRSQEVLFREHVLRKPDSKSQFLKSQPK